MYWQSWWGNLYDHDIPEELDVVPVPLDAVQATLAPPSAVQDEVTGELHSVADLDHSGHCSVLIKGHASDTWNTMHWIIPYLSVLNASVSLHLELDLRVIKALMTASKVWVHLRSLTASFFVGISIQIASGLGSYGPRLRISAGPSLPPSRIPMDRGQIEATEAGGGNSGLCTHPLMYRGQESDPAAIWHAETRFENNTLRGSNIVIKIKLVTYLRQTKTTYTFFLHSHITLIATSDFWC